MVPHDDVITNTLDAAAGSGPPQFLASSGRSATRSRRYSSGRSLDSGSEQIEAHQALYLSDEFLALRPRQVAETVAKASGPNVRVVFQFMVWQRPERAGDRRPVRGRDYDQIVVPVQAFA